MKEEEREREREKKTEVSLEIVAPTARTLSRPKHSMIMKHMHAQIHFPFF